MASVWVVTRQTDRADEAGVETAYGDVFDKSSLTEALTGCETLYLIPPYFPSNPVPQTLEATRNGMDAALAAGVDRVIYTSGTRTIGVRRQGSGKEETPHRGFYLSAEEEAKARGEQMALSYAKQGLKVTVVCPGFVYGPGDRYAIGQYLAQSLNGTLPGMFAATMGFVYIDDVGEGHVLAAAKGAPGHRYILSERNASMYELFHSACRQAGVKPVRRLPAVLAAALAAGGEVTARLTGRPAPFDWPWYREYIAYGLRADGSRAVRELGLTYTPLEEGLRRTIVWQWEQGLLKRKPACV